MIGLLWAGPFKRNRYLLESFPTTVKETICYTGQVRREQVGRARHVFYAPCFMDEERRVLFEFRTEGAETLQVLSIRVDGNLLPSCSSCDVERVDDRELRLAGSCVWKCIRTMTLMVDKDEEWYLIVKHTGRISRAFQGRVLDVKPEEKTGIVRLWNGCLLKVRLSTRRHVRYGSMTSRVAGLVYECPFTGRVVSLV